MANTMEVDIAIETSSTSDSTKCCNKLPLTNNDSGSNSIPSIKPPTPVPDPQPDFSVLKPNSLQLRSSFSSSLPSPRIRRLSTNGLAFNGVTPRTPSRLDQLKLEESFTMATKEAESERAMLDAKKVADACSDWSLSDVDDDNVGECSTGNVIKNCRPVSEQLHVFTSPSTFSQTCSPSPTRFAQKGAILNPGRSFTPSPSQSPTRRHLRRSISPIVSLGLRPSVIGAKRKFDADMFDRIERQGMNSPIKRPALHHHWMGGAQDTPMSSNGVVEAVNCFSPSNSNLSNGSGNDSGIDSPDLHCPPRPQPASSCPVRPLRPITPTTPPIFNHFGLTLSGKNLFLPAQPNNTNHVNTASGSVADSEDNSSIASNDDELQRLSEQSSLCSSGLHLSNTSEPLRSEDFVTHFTPVSTTKSPLSCPASPSIRGCNAMTYYQSSSLQHQRPLSAAPEGNTVPTTTSAVTLEQLRPSNAFILPAFNRKSTTYHRIRSLSSGPSSCQELFSETTGSSIISKQSLPLSPLLLSQSEIVTRSKNRVNHLITTPNNSPNPHSDSSMTDEEK